MHGGRARATLVTPSFIGGISMRTSLRVRLGAGTLLAVALLAGACGGGDDDEATGRATSVAGVPDGAAYVDQDGLKFNPSSLTVSGGEPVFFKNSETTVHTVTINGKNESGTMKADQVFEWTPPGPGEYKITCEFHPQMKATLTVQ